MMFSLRWVYAIQGRGPGADDRERNVRDPIDLPERSDRLLDEGKRNPELGAVPRPRFDREISAHGRDEAVSDHEAQAVARRLVVHVRHVESVEECGNVFGVNPRSVVN